MAGPGPLPTLRTLARGVYELRALLMVAGLVALAGQILILLPFAFDNPGFAIDAVQLQAAGERIRSEEPLYWHWADYGPHIDAPDGPQRPLESTAYPPLVLPAFALVPDLPFETFARVWAAVLLAGLWVYAAALARIATGRVSPGGFLIAAFVLALTPGAGTSIKQGNIDPWIWAAYGWALARPGFLGAGLGLAASVKVFFIWPLLLAVRDRKAWRDAALVFTGLGALAMAIMGPSDFLAACIGWFREVPAYHGQGTFRPWNVSLSFAVLRVARALGWDFVPGPLPAGWHVYLLVMGVSAPVIAAWMLRRKARDVRVAGVVCTAVLFSPICWLSYAPLALPLAAIGLRPRLPGADSAGVPSNANTIAAPT